MIFSDFFFVKSNKIVDFKNYIFTGNNYATVKMYISKYSEMFLVLLLLLFTYILINAKKISSLYILKFYCIFFFDEKVN